MGTIGEPWPEYNDGIYYRDRIRRSDAGLTLIEFYSTRHGSSAPLQGWLQRLRNKQVSIDNTVVTDPDTVLREGAELVYHRLPWREPDVPYQLEVLYEDNYLIAVNKPPGLQVLPGGLFQQRTVLMQLQWHPWKVSVKGCQEPHPVPVHRLGRGTSGILLCAKTKLAKSRLAAYFADGTSSIQENDRLQTSTRSIRKIYRALVNGLVDANKVDIGQPIGVVKYPGVAKGLYVASPSGKPAFSKAIVLERRVQSNTTLVEVEIQSGRPHQIRIHLAFIGYPLVGDPLYAEGGQPKITTHHEAREQNFAAGDGGHERPENPLPGDCGYHLHAHRVSFPHPATREIVEISAPLPSILKTRGEYEASYCM